MNNEMQWSSATPGLLIILMDQSGSMTLPYDGGDTRTVFAAKAVNRVIDTIIQKNFNGKAPKNRCFICAIGYDVEAKTLVSGYLADLNANPLRIETVKQKIGDVDTETSVPIWVEPIKDDKWTNMTAGFQMAYEIVEKWISQKPNNPAPVIINISDGVPYYDCKSIEECMDETIKVVEKIKQQAKQYLENIY